MTTKSRILTWPGGEYDRNIPDISLAEFLINRMKRFGDQIACVIVLNIDLPKSCPLIFPSSLYFQINSETKAQWTFSNIINTTSQLAAGLQLQQRILPKQTVAITLPNCMECPIAVLAIILCGGTAVIINPNQTICKVLKWFDF